LLLLCLNTFGLITVYKILQIRAKKVAEVAIRKASAKFVVFEDIQKDNSVKWEDKDEFSYKGKMYDVAKEEIKNGKHLYLCYDDVAEACICQKIDAVVNAQLGNEKDPSGNVVFHLMIMLCQVFIPADPYNCITPEVNTHHHFTYGQYACYYSSSYTHITAPPPKMVWSAVTLFN